MGRNVDGRVKKLILNRSGRVEISVKNMKEQKRSSKTTDIVSYDLEVSVNGVTSVFVVHFRSSDTFYSL